MKNRVIAIGYAAIIVLTLVALSVLFATSFRSADDGDGEGDENREWRWDGPEVERAAKLAFAYSWMIISTLALGTVAFRVLKRAAISDASVPRAGMGVLGGSTLLYASTALICSLYFWDMGYEEADEGDADNQGGDEDNQGRFLREDDEEGIGSHLISVSCLVLFAVYLVLSAVIFAQHNYGDGDGDCVDEVPVSDRPTETDIARSGAHLDVLYDSWRAFSVVSMSLLLLTLIVSIIPIFLEDAERLQDEGNIFNFLWILVWMILLFICIIYSGKRVFRSGNGIIASKMETGALGGALLFFSSQAFLLAVLYGSFAIEDHHREDSPLGSVAFSYLCLFLAAASIFFALGLNKYCRPVFTRESVNSEPQDSSNGNFFVSMDKDIS
uniref:Uncharacterized protein n=1 Tax=Odontella aurita TaxID=265563 RepID=A0A7S4ND42_9STRA|mmetsp:Transcript_58873/g.175166  ORF Transcript_58873/g.175166 Transcript_58873/m.175166 type:complete len:384 (+) Transcript_58873:251-1402(+)